MLQGRTLIYVTDHLSMGGTKTYLDGLLEACIREKINYIVITFGTKDVGNNNYSKATEHVHIRIPRPSLYMLPLRIGKLLPIITSFVKKYPGSIILSDLILPASSLIFIKKYSRMKNKIFYQFHGLDSLEKQSRYIFQEKKDKFLFKFYQKVRKNIERHTLKRVDKVFCFSEYSIKLLQENIAKKLNIVKILPGYDYEIEAISRNISKLEAREKSHLSLHKKVVLYVGRIEPRKGIFELIDALSKKNNAYFNDKSFIFASSYSDGYFTFKFFEKHEELKLGTKTMFFNSPSRKELAYLYKASDVVVLPSTNLETYGFVSQESLICKTPIVAFDIGANKEIIDRKYLVSKNKGINGLIKKTNEILFNEDRIKKNQYLLNNDWQGYVNRLFIE